MTMRVLLTGADGYIGAIMGPKLIEAGHEVVGVDTGYYRRGWLFDDGRAHPTVVSKDLRRIAVDDLEGFDAVVHLSELSNDPIGENDPGLTMEINHQGSVGLAARRARPGSKRFIYASSCSTYGAGGDEMRTETSDARAPDRLCPLQDPGRAGASRADGRRPSPRSSCATPPPTAPARGSASTWC